MMAERSVLEEYKQNLGALLGNFQSLEFCLRAFLQALPTARPMGIPHGTDLYSYPVGSELPENEFTSYDSLGLLIDKFNSEMKKRGLAEIDKTLVEVRDALAHGRVSSNRMNAPLRLLKFDKPMDGHVRVTFNQELTKAWFSVEVRRVTNTIRFVANFLTN